MAVGTADLHQAIQSAWTDHGIDHEFKKFWVESERSSYPALHEQEAGPSQPFPYCVFDQGIDSIAARMTGTTIYQNRELRDYPWDFVLYAKEVGSRSAKHVAVELLDVLLQKFGGHPDVLPVDLVLTNGAVYQVQYQGDMPMRQGDDEYAWRVSYKIQVDVPVKVA